MGRTYGASRPAVLRLTVPCDLAEVRPASQEAATFLAAQGCDENELMSCSLAFVEAVNNAIRYAAPESQRLPVLVEAMTTDQTIEFRVTDHTAGFEWPQEFNLPPQDSESGRGLYLIHTLSHEAGYLRGHGQNVLHFMRRRSSAPLAVPANTPEEVRLQLAENDRVITQMVEELSSCYESLASIFRHSRMTHEPGRLQAFAQRLLEELIQIVGADWFLLRLASGNHTQLETFAASDASLHLDALPLVSAQHICAELEAALTRQEVWFDTRTPGSTIDPTWGLPQVKYFQSLQ